MEFLPEVSHREVKLTLVLQLGMDEEGFGGLIEQEFDFWKRLMLNYVTMFCNYVTYSLVAIGCIVFRFAKLFKKAWRSEEWQSRSTARQKVTLPRFPTKYVNCTKI